MTVAVGERPHMEELEPISSDKQIIRCPLENLAKLGKMLLREVYEEDLYETTLAICVFWVFTWQSVSRRQLYPSPA